jgi:hypothetical protein
LSTAESALNTAAKYVTAAGSRASTGPAVPSTAVAYVSTAESVVTTVAAVETRGETSFFEAQRQHRPPASTTPRVSIEDPRALRVGLPHDRCAVPATGAKYPALRGDGGILGAMPR